MPAAKDRSWSGPCPTGRRAPDRRRLGLPRPADRSRARHSPPRPAFSGGLAAARHAVASPEARRAFGLTLWVTLFATVINTVFGVAFAIVLVRHRFWGRTLADGVVDLPFAVSPIIAGLMLVLVYGPNGPLGRWLESAGLRVVYAWPGLVLATMFVTVPFVVREVVPVLREFGRRPDSGGRPDASRPAWWRTFWKVTLPRIR